MPQSNYIESIGDITTAVAGNSAPNTGQYYSYIYSQKDSLTGVPTMEVQLHNNNSDTLPQIPQSLNNLSNTQVLEVVRNDTQIHLGSAEPPNQFTVQNNEDALSGGGGLSLASIIMLTILMGLVAFIYFIIRIWQNNQIQRSIMSKISTIDTDDKVAVTNTEPVISTTRVEQDWRRSIELEDDKLKELLNRKGIIGDSISDKLKTVNSGEFASIDIAWEAHQSAKKLLSLHDDDVQEYSIKRVLQLFKQVFAQNDVV